MSEETVRKTGLIEEIYVCQGVVFIKFANGDKGKLSMKSILAELGNLNGKTFFYDYNKAELENCPDIVDLVWEKEE